MVPNMPLGKNGLKILAPHKNLANLQKTNSKRFMLATFQIQNLQMERIENKIKMRKLLVVVENTPTLDSSISEI